MPNIAWFVIGIAFGWLSSFTGTALGAYVVFRTKREPHEQFMSLREPKGEAFNLEDSLIDEVEEEPKAELPSIVKRMNERFRGQQKGAE